MIVLNVAGSLNLCFENASHSMSFFLYFSEDIVYIGTLQINHLGTGKLFMTHKKGVLIEKPLAMNSREVQELIAAAQDNSVFLMEVIYSGFPLIQELLAEFGF